MQERVQSELEEQKRAAILEETNRIVERYKTGVARLGKLYASSLAEYNAEAEQNETDELEEAKRQTEDEWREASEDRVSAVMGQVSDERRKRVKKEEELQAVARRCSLQLKTQDQVLTELEGNQEYQKWLIQLQADVLAGQPLATTLPTLV